MSVFFGVHDSGLSVISHSLFEEVSLSLDRDDLHPWERVLGVVELGVPKGEDQSVRHKLHVLTHQLRIHPDQLDGKGLGQEFLLKSNRLGEDLVDGLFRELVFDVGIHQTGEIGVETLIPRNELVGESEPWHEGPLLQPVNRAEGPGEENSLDGGIGHKAF